MKIQILGTGCPKCKKLEQNVRQAVELLGKDIAVEKISDIMQIASFGVMSTPALVIDGVVVSYGKLLTIEEITTLIEK